MGWFRDRAGGFLDNFIYDMLWRMISALSPFLLPILYFWLAKAGKLPWSTLALIVVLLIAVVLMCVIAVAFLKAARVKSEKKNGRFMQPKSALDLVPQTIFQAVDYLKKLLSEGEDKLIRYQTPEYPLVSRRELDEYLAKTSAAVRSHVFVGRVNVNDVSEFEQTWDNLDALTWINTRRDWGIERFNSMTDEQFEVFYLLFGRIERFKQLIAKIESKP